MSSYEIGDDLEVVSGILRIKEDSLIRQRFQQGERLRLKTKGLKMIYFDGYQFRDAETDKALSKVRSEGNE